MPPARRGSRPVQGAIYEAAHQDDRLGLLEAMRDRIAQQLDNPETLARDLAALSKRLMEVLDEIAEFKRTDMDPVEAAAEAGDEAYE